MTGIEPVASSLPRTRSTPELHRLKSSGRRGSNSRHSAWKADALPTELLPLGNLLQCHMHDTQHRKKCGGNRNRTYSVKDNRVTVCPGSPTPAYPLDMLMKLVCAGFYSVSRWRDSNPRPVDYKSTALTTELHRQKIKEHTTKKTP